MACLAASSSSLNRSNNTVNVSIVCFTFKRVRSFSQHSPLRLRGHGDISVFESLKALLYIDSEFNPLPSGNCFHLVVDCKEMTFVI